VTSQCDLFPYSVIKSVVQYKKNQQLSTRTFNNQRKILIAKDFFCVNLFLLLPWKFNYFRGLVRPEWDNRWDKNQLLPDTLFWVVCGVLNGKGFI